MGGKNAGKNFSRNTIIVRPKNVGEKNVGKKCEKAFFFIPTNIVPKNGGKETRETIVPEKRIVRLKNVRKKIFG